MSRAALGALILLASLVAAASVRADDRAKEPTGFAGVIWGTPLKSVYPKRNHCHRILGNWPAEARLRGCVRHEPIGQVPVEVHHEFDDVEGLVRVRLLFASRSFDFIRGVFVERYGPPTSESIETVRNLIGATFQSSLLGWSGSTVEISLAQLRPKPDVSEATLTLTRWANAAREEMKAAEKKAAESLD